MRLFHPIVFGYLVPHPASADAKSVAAQVERNARGCDSGAARHACVADPFASNGLPEATCLERLPRRPALRR
jgi:hypothetical protein